jgi:hypothetical protein
MGTTMLIASPFRRDPQRLQIRFGVVQADVPADRAPDSGEDIDGDEPGVSAAVDPIRYALVAALWERWARPWPTITPILGDMASDLRLCGGRSWDRTSDPLLVREVLYR